MKNKNNKVYPLKNVSDIFTEGMMQLRMMLNKDIEAIASTPNVAHRFPKDILLIIQFEDGHKHISYPDLDTTKYLLEHFLEELNKGRLK